MVENASTISESSSIFQATTSEISHITSVLGAITQVGTFGSIFINPNGMIFVCDKVRTIRVSATFDKSLFDQFYYNPREEDIIRLLKNNNSSQEDDRDNLRNSQTDVSSEEDDDNNNNWDETQDILNKAEAKKIIENAKHKTTKLNIDFNTFMESFNIASSQYSKDEIVKCTMYYNGYGSPFVVKFTDSIMTEKCEFGTFVDEDNLDYEHLYIDSEMLLMEVLVSADVIYDSLNTLKDMNSEELYVYASKKTTSQRTLDNQKLVNNKLMFISKGEMGYSRFIFLEIDELALRKVDQDLLRIVNMNDDFLISVFHFDMFKKIMKAIKLCDKVRLRKDHKGVISIHLLTTDNLESLMNSGISRYKNMQISKSKMNSHNSITKPKYCGTIVEFTILELVVGDENGNAEGFDKSELTELISIAENISDINPKNRKRKIQQQTSNFRSIADSNLRQSNIVEILKKSKNKNVLPIVNINRGINEIFHGKNDLNPNDGDFNLDNDDYDDVNENIIENNNLYF